MRTLYKKSLKIPKGQSESVYRRRTDNTMAKEKVQKDKQRSTKHTHKTKDRVTRTPLKFGGECRCSGGISSSCSTSDTRRVNLVSHGSKHKHFETKIIDKSHCSIICFFLLFGWARRHQKKIILVLSRLVRSNRPRL
jgi:hypothetical protein